MKKYTSIEQQITEGFWDALVNKAKEIKLNTKAAFGDREASGKLSAHLLATQMYDQFKVWAGKSGLKATVENVPEFLETQVRMDPNFVQQQVGLPNQHAAQQQQQGGSNNYDAAIGVQGGGNNSSSQGQAGNNANANTPYNPTPGDFKPQEKANISRFMQLGPYKQFTRNRDASGYNADPNEPLSANPDGTFLFADSEERVDELKELLAKSDRDPKAAIAEMKKDNFFVTWDDFKANIPGGDRIPKDSEAEADLFRQAMVQADAVYNKNAPKAIRRYVLATPPSNPSETFLNNAKQAAIQIKEAELMEKRSDQQLRDLFLKIAQNGLRNGAINQAKADAAQAMRQTGSTTPGQGQQQQQPQQQQSGGEAIIAKAKQFGDYLGVSLSKYDLRTLRDKNRNVFNQFMHDLNTENPPNWDPDFVAHYSKVFNVQGTPPGATGANNTPGQTGNVGKGAAANDTNKWIEIRGEKVHWDEKNGVLSVATKDPKKGNMVTTEYEPLPNGGWAVRGASGKSFPPNNGIAQKLTDMQDEYMEKTGMSKPQQDIPKAKNGEVPVGAKVKANGGEYTFDGKVWKNANGQAVPSEKSNQHLSAMYNDPKHPGHNTNPAPAANDDDEQDDQDEQGDDQDQEQGQENPAQPAKPAATAQPAQAQQPAQPAQPAQAARPQQPVKPANAQNAQNDDDEDGPPVPNNATFNIPGTKRVIQRKGDGWVDGKGNKITNPSQVATFDRGYNNSRKKA